MKQLQLNFQVDEVLLGQVMRNDRKRIIQVFNNIISNSIKFTFSGHINIQITQNIQDQQCLNVECEDSGGKSNFPLCSFLLAPGLPPETRSSCDPNIQGCAPQAERKMFFFLSIYTTKYFRVL